MKYISLITLSLCVSNLSFAQSQSEVNIDGAWAGFSDPEIMSSGFTHKFSALPLEGQMETGTKAWSSTYWPSNKGSIANRWNSPNKETFNYASPNRAQVGAMSQAQLAVLSPAEKYDLLLGQYDYPLKSIAHGSSSRHAKDWAGICHGWAPAALHHSEPTPKTITNPDGIAIPFGSADIKGILSLYYAFYTDDQETDQIGLRCFFGSWLGGAKGCNEDLNAGAFHIVIANKMGIQKEGFLVDIDRYNEVWNQPALGYKSRVVNNYLPRSRGAASNATHEIRVATDFFYIDESEPTWNVVYGTKDQVVTKKEYLYRLEINAQGNIVGGVWESEERPDFIWNKNKVTAFEGIFSRLPELLND